MHFSILFSMDNYQKLIDQLVKKNIKNELTAGIMPIYNIDSLCNMAKKCGINIPAGIINRTMISAMSKLLLVFALIK